MPLHFLGSLLGEKGKGGQRNGEGERPESGDKCRAAQRANSGEPRVEVLYEEELLPFLLSPPAAALVRARDGRARRRCRRSLVATIATPADPTSLPSPAPPPPSHPTPPHQRRQ